MRRLGRQGFTLVEIMIVVAIIILLAAIAIPNLLRARHNANESAAIGAVRTISTAAESWRAAQTTPAYPTTLATMASVTPPYIDSTLAGGAKQGYTYAYTLDSANEYSLIASPATSGVTGTRLFFVDESGVLREGSTSAGTPIQ
ncbi:MAG: prepilin-type N-terminal cleavage/methylation domain-containing protein [Candidatus Omnitrophota bacterium]